MNKLRIFLADDHEVVRHGLKLLINSQADMEVVGEAGDGSSAVLLILELRPDIVVMDVSMPGLNGQHATQQLKKELSNVKIMALTRHNDTSYLQQLLQAGVDGYVLKQSNSDELLRAIRVIGVGGKYIDPAITDKVIGSFASKKINRTTEGAAGLSERESEVLRLIALGYSNKEIATRFDLSVKTVEVHKANAMKKLEMQSRVDIIRYAILQGWLQDA
jgi:DNA-binding NarL/FixJ family response regulator